MDFKKTKAPNSIVTRDMNDLSSNVGNVYETVNIIAKRANQINLELKEKKKKKLQEYGSLTDNLEEITENREQIAISRYYEKIPKATLIATQEFIEDKVVYRDPSEMAE